MGHGAACYPRALAAGHARPSKVATGDGPGHCRYSRCTTRPGSSPSAPWPPGPAPRMCTYIFMCMYAFTCVCVYVCVYVCVCVHIHLYTPKLQISLILHSTAHAQRGCMAINTQPHTRQPEALTHIHARTGGSRALRRVFSKSTLYSDFYIVLY
jgi:hypothetical protein